MYGKLVVPDMRLILILFAILAFQAAPAAACESTEGSRGVALLIGVADYRSPAGTSAANSWPRLNNAVHDVDHVCAAMAAAGFQTIVVRNPTFEGIDAALIEFRQAASQSDYAVVYYAGHGFEFRGEAFIVPVDAPRTSSQGRLIGDFLPMERLLDAASRAREFGLFLMDACRTRTPPVELQDMADTQGELTAMGLFSVPKGAVIFSTVSGRPAWDEAPVGSSISPFANSIVTGMRTPNLELGAFYDLIHSSVVAQTQDMYPGGPQYPAFYKIAPSSFYLVAPAETAAAQTPSATSLVLPPIERLAIEDEPVLMREVLSRHPVAAVISAAEAGDAAAQYLLGYAYSFGVGVRTDRVQAREWMERSAAQDHPGGLTELAYFLQQEALDGGTLLPEAERQQLREQSLALYRRAVSQDYAKAQSHLGHTLMTGTLGVQDRDYAIALFSEAASAGHVYATAALAMNVPAARDRSLQRLREIADAGNAEGNNWLCELHYSSTGFHQDNAERVTATRDCEIAALHSFAGSRVIYATILANGMGVEQAPYQAAYWAQLASSQPELATRPDLVEIATLLSE